MVSSRPPVKSNTPPRSPYDCARYAWMRAKGDPDAPDAPPIYLGKHCEFCRHRTACTESAERAGDLALLPSLAYETWTHMRADGLRTLTDVAAEPVDRLQRFRKIGPVTAREYNGWARARLSGAPQPIQLPAPDVHLPGLYLDIETSLFDWENGVPWSFGWCDADGRYTNLITAPVHEVETLILPDGQPILLIPDHRDGWRRVADAAAAVEGYVFHWSGYEAGVLKATSEGETIARLYPRLHDLLATFKRTWIFPIANRSIKTVAAYLGYRYPEGSHYAQAWNDYRLWRDRGDVEALARAIAYQRADVEAVWLVWRWLGEHR